MKKRFKGSENLNIFPYDDEEILEFRDGCLKNIELRHQQYKDFRSILFDNEKKNSISKTIDDVVSLVYLPDNILFDIVVDPDKEELVKDSVQKKLDKLNKVLNEKFVKDTLDIEFYDWLFWACVYGIYIVKTILDGDTITFKGVSPFDFAVYYEDNRSLDKDQIFLHISRIPIHVARKKYPDANFIPSVTSPTRQDNFLDIVVTQNQQTNLFNVSPIPLKDEDGLTPKKVGEYAEVYEMWFWDYTRKDWFMAQIVGDKIYKSVNPFIPKEHPFIVFTPTPVEGFFWGLSELHYLTHLYLRIKDETQRLDKVEELLSAPPLIVYGASSSVNGAELQEKIRKAGSVSEIYDPTANFNFYLPKIDPNVIFNAIKYYDEAFKEQSGIVGVLGGRAMPNVRSASYANILAQFASTVLKKKALRVEAFIEEVMTMMANCIVYTDTEYKEFLNIPFRVDVFAHTSSPITSLAYQEMVLNLAENQIIPPDVVIELLPIPRKEKILKFMQQKALMSMQESAADKSTEKE